MPTTVNGYQKLLHWAEGFGPVGCAGVEGTGSYGASLARYLKAAGCERVAEMSGCIAERVHPLEKPALNSTKTSIHRLIPYQVNLRKIGASPLRK